MTSVIIIIICLAILVYLYREFFKYNEFYNELSSGEIPEFIKVHEAGHFVVAHCCTAVSEFASIRIAPTKGCVEFAITKSPECALVILMAGIAAETFKLKKFRSGNAETDLQKATSIVGICDTNKLNNLYSRKTNTNIDFKNMFTNISEHEAKTIKLAFEIAKAIIEDKQPLFSKAISSFDNECHLTSADVRDLFGCRGPMEIVYTIQGEKFI